MKKSLIATLAELVICGTALCAQTMLKWHWWTVGLDEVGAGEYVVIHATGKEVVMCVQMYRQLEGEVHGGVLAVSCVRVK